MDANWRDGRWHVVKAFPKPFVWLRRQWLALRWVDGAWERYGQWYSRDRAEAEVKLLNDTEEWIDALHARIDNDRVYSAAHPLYVVDLATGESWRADSIRPDGLTIRALDRSHMGCG